VDIDLTSHLEHPGMRTPTVHGFEITKHRKCPGVVSTQGERWRERETKAQYVAGTTQSNAMLPARRPSAKTEWHITRLGGGSPAPTFQREGSPWLGRMGGTRGRAARGLVNVINWS
jgi:hypothetical protein